MLPGAVGVIVTGGGGAPFEALGVGPDAALTPFGGKYLFLDLALATLLNSNVRAIYVAAAATRAVRAHLARTRMVRRPPVVRPLAARAGEARAGRIARALHEYLPLLQSHDPEAVVVLTADHVLQLDLAPLVAAHRDADADVTLATLPAALVEAAARPRLRVAPDGHVLANAPDDEAPGPGDEAWTGDLIVSGQALARLLRATASAPTPADDSALLARIVTDYRVMVYDALARRATGPARGPYWHDPTTLEAYYAAQMNLCTSRPSFDLHDVGWPLPAMASSLGPSKVVVDAAGRAGHTLNTLVADGCLIRGAYVQNAVLGHGVVVESGAEVEDSVLLDGCRIGAGAHVRRAVVGRNAVVAGGDEIGYGPPPAGATLAPSGLTLVPCAPAPTLAAEASR